MIGDGIRTQIGGGKFLYHFVQQVGIIQLRHKLIEFEVLKNLPCIFGETLHISAEVGTNVVLTHGAEVELGRVEERQSIGGAYQEFFLRLFWQVLVLNALVFSQYFVFAVCQYTLQTAQQGKRQDNAPVLRLSKVTTQQVCYRPNKCCCL